MSMLHIIDGIAQHRYQVLGRLVIAMIEVRLVAQFAGTAQVVETELEVQFGCNITIPINIQYSTESMDSLSHLPWHIGTT